MYFDYKLSGVRKKVMEEENKSDQDDVFNVTIHLLSTSLIPRV
jgi:hypothetical protein